MQAKYINLWVAVYTKFYKQTVRVITVIFVIVVIITIYCPNNALRVNSEKGSKKTELGTRVEEGKR